MRSRTCCCGESFFGFSTLSGIGMAFSGCALTCFCNFTGAGAWGTIDVVSLASGFTGPSRRGMGIVLTMVTPTDPLLARGEPKLFFVRLNIPEAASNAITTP